MDTQQPVPGEIRTISVTTAGALIALGCEPRGIGEARDGRQHIRFGPEARAAMGAFNDGKARAECLLDEADVNARARRIATERELVAFMATKAARASGA